MSATTKRPAPSPQPSKRTGWIIGGVVAVIVVVAGVIAIVSSGGDDGDNAAPAVTEPSAGETPTTVDPATTGAGGGAPAATVAPASTPAASIETGPVTVSGAPLPQLQDGTDPVVGRQAPSLTGVGFDNSTVTVAPGKPTLVVFLAHWCPHCQREVPRLVEWAGNGEVPAGVDVIGVATATSSDRDNYPPSEWLTREGWPFPVMVDDADSTAALAMGLSAYPYFVLLDADGKVALRESGEIDTADLTDQITTALGA